MVLPSCFLFQGDRPRQIDAQVNRILLHVDRILRPLYAPLRGPWCAAGSS